MILHCRRYGFNGPALIFLHGILGLSDNWIGIAQKFSDRFSVFIPDLRNHGLSPHSDEFGYNSMKDDVLQMIEQYDIKDPIIVGHSMGGKLAMIIALNNPEIVSKLIVVDISPALYKELDLGRILKIMRQFNFSAVNSRGQIADYFNTHIDDKGIVQLILKNVKINERRQFLWKPNIAALHDQLDELLSFPEFSMPYFNQTLFIKGENSDFINNENTSAIKSLFPKSIIQEIGNSGHWIHADNPNDLVKLIRSFII